MVNKSPNYRKGRAGQRPEAIVIHITDGAFAGAVSWLCNPISQVSAHYVISFKGEVVQLVDEADTAWHAGKAVRPTWQKLKQGINPNSYTIGIECEGYKDKQPTRSQYLAIIELVKSIGERWGIKLTRDQVIGHREIRADKTCPGQYLDLEMICKMANLAR